jgi:hypothetical protein
LDSLNERTPLFISSRAFSFEHPALLSIVSKASIPVIAFDLNFIEFLHRPEFFSGSPNDNRINTTDAQHSFTEDSQTTPN